MVRTKAIRAMRRKAADERNAIFAALPLDEKIRRNPKKAAHYTSLAKAKQA